MAGKRGPQSRPVRPSLREQPVLTELLFVPASAFHVLRELQWPVFSRHFYGPGRCPVSESFQARAVVVDRFWLQGPGIYTRSLNVGRANLGFNVTCFSRQRLMDPC